MASTARALGLLKRVPSIAPHTPSFPSNPKPKSGAGPRRSKFTESNEETLEEEPLGDEATVQTPVAGHNPRSKHDYSPPSIMRGVTVKWLVDFTNKHKCWDMPTYRVVDEIVKPLTADKSCRVVDLPSVKATGAVGEAKVFVSHAWGAMWGSLVAACNHGTQQSMRVWVDVLAISQHAGVQQANDLQELEMTVHMSSALLLIVSVPSGLSHGSSFTDDMRRQIPFDRIWCLLEIYAAHKTQTPIVMKIGHVKSNVHHTWHPEENWGTTNKLLYLVNVKEARSRFEEDKVRILKEVKKIARSYNRADSIIRGAIVGAAWGAWLPEVQAAAMGDIKILQSVYRKYPDLEKKGVTPLISSAASGHLPVVKELLKMGATVNKVASHITPLWVTAQGGHEKVLVELLRSGADVSICDPEGRSPLLIAAEGGHLGVIKLLLGQNADMLDGDIRGRTAAFLAAEHGHTEVLQELLRLGSPMGTRSKDGRTLLMAAAEAGHLHIVTSIINYYNQSTLSMTDVKGRNVAFLAAARGHHQILQELLKAGVDVSKPDVNDVTPLVAAAEFGDAASVEVLLNSEEYGNILRYQMTGDLRLMFAAIRGGNSDVVRICMDAGCGPRKRSGLKKLAATAAVLGHRDVLKVMLPLFKGSVSFSEQDISVEGAQTIAKTLTTQRVASAKERFPPARDCVTALDMSACGLHRSGTLAIAHMLAPEKAGSCIPLSTLLLDLNNIGPKGTAVIVDAMLGDVNKNTTLTNLRLSRNDVGEKGAKHIARLLHPGASNLQMLDLWWNDLGPAGVEYICQALTPAFKGGCSVLTTLCLENNCVDDAGAEALARVLRPRKDGNTSRLTHLDLTSNEITAEGAQELARALESTYGSGDDESKARRGNRNLRILLMPDNEIGASGAAALVQATLHSDSVLHTLDISENHVGPTGALAVGDALQTGSSITDINISGNNIGGEALTSLATALLPRHSLMFLNVSRNSLTSQDISNFHFSAEDLKPAASASSMRRITNSKSKNQLDTNIGRTIILAGNRISHQEVKQAFAAVPGLSAHL